MAASLGDWKVLGQNDLAAATLTDTYTVPSGSKSLVQDVIFCNRAGAGTTVRLAVSPNGADIEDKHYLLYDYTLAANGVVSLASLRGGAPLHLGDTDVVRTYSTATNVSVNVLGKEIAG